MNIVREGYFVNMSFFKVELKDDDLSKYAKSKVRTKVVLSFSFSLLFFMLVFVIRLNNNISLKRDNNMTVVENECEHISRTIDCIMARVNTLQALVQDNNGDTEFFRNVADDIYDLVKLETGVELKNVAIAPNGVVSDVYPMEGNESLIGFDFLDLSKEGNLEAKEAYEKGDIVLTNPFELVQGGMGMAGRAPVIIHRDDKDELWGLVTVTIDFDKLIEELNLDRLQSLGLDYGLYYIGGDGPTAIKTHGTVGKEPIKKRFNIKNLVWELAVVPEEGWLPVRRCIIAFTMVFFLSLFVSVFVYMIYRLRYSNAELKKMTEQALAASEAKTLFLSNMSHEIRTPINAVLGMNEMIQRECNDNDILAYSDNIKNAGTTLLRLINDVLDLSRIESGKTEIICVNYSLASMINNLVNMIRNRAEDKGLVLVLEFDRNIPGELNGDESHITQIMTNLLTNAVKYTDTGNILFHMDYEEIESEPDCIMLNVSVTDTGIGIKRTDMGRLFNAFERIEEEKKRNVEGTGLGLSITQNLLGMMGAELKVESTYGFGSKFYFSLKQRVVDREPLGDYETYSHARLNRNKRYRERFIAPDAAVLVVDDNPMNLEVIKSFLKKTEIKVDTAESGDEALELAAKKEYDVIFFDHMMPEKDGIVTFHELKEQKDNPNINTPAICLTANAISGARERYIAEGFDDYLSKPVSPKKLENTLMMYLPGNKIIFITGDNGAGEEEEDYDIGSGERLNTLNEHEEIDVRSGIENSGSVRDFFAMIELFCDRTDADTSELDGYYDEGDTEKYTVKVHAMKNSLRIIGAIGLGEIAQKLEDAGKKKDMDFIREHHEVFMVNIRQLKTMLKDYITDEEETGGDKKPADDNMISEAYMKIREAAVSYDSDSWEKVYEQMSEYSIPKSEEDKWNKVKTAADQYDYDRVIELLK